MLAILADDMTGALDSAAPFAGRGLHTEVALTLSAIHAALAEKPDVLAINLGSRELTEQQARNLSAQALALLPEDTVLFKKIDSRLKGHIKAELDPFKYKKALIAPAIPEFDRVVKDGEIQGFGIQYPIPLAKCLKDHASRALIPDTLTAADMDQALVLAKAEGVDLFVGARGLAEAIARNLTKRDYGKFVQLPQGKALFVIGSQDPITLAQIDHLVQNMRVSYIRAPNGLVNHADRKAIQSDLILVQASNGAEISSGQQVSQNLANSVHPEFTNSVKTLLMCGGETANAIMNAMNIDHFRLLGECLPGLAVANYGDQWLIAKSGGFGDSETLVQIAKQVRIDGAENEN